MNPKDWQAQVQAHLDAQADAVDYATRSQLNQIRQQALARGAKTRRRNASQTAWLTASLAGISAAACALVLAFVVQFEAGKPAPSVNELLTEFEAVQLDPEFSRATLTELRMLESELLLADDSLELIENLAFYLWLQTQSSPG